MFLSKMKLDISDSLKIWCTDYTARYYELQEQYLKNVIVNIIWLSPKLYTVLLSY